MSKVLVVIDMQNDFITGTLGTPEAKQIINKVVEKINSYNKLGATVFYTRDTHKENYLSTQEGKKLPVMHCIKGSSGWELAPEISETVKEQGQIIDKITFGSIELAERLQALYTSDNTLEVELIGVCTDICVVSNALLLKAYCPEMTIKVDASCCAGVTPLSHQNALETMKMCQIEVEN